MKKKAKKYFIPSAALIASFYISLLFAVGAVLGYLGLKVFDKKFIKTGKVEPFTIELGKWEIHLHHWITGSLAISGLCLLTSASMPVFWLGALGGLVFHDIHTDKNWYRVIYKK